MKTLIPAAPGYFAVYDDCDDRDPIIAWEVTYHLNTLEYSVWPITPVGLAGDYHRVEFRG